MTSLRLMLGGLALVNLMGAASPGPAFFVVSRSAAGEGRAAGLATGMGVAVATLVWASAVIHGLALLVAEAAWLFRVVQVLGGAYLLYLGWQAFRHAPDPLPTHTVSTARASALTAFQRGFVVNLTNPKVMVFFASVFASVYAPGLPEWTNLAVLAVIAAVELAWYSTVALALSTRAAQAVYGRAKRWVDRAFAAIIAVFGLRLIWHLPAIPL